MKPRRPALLPTPPPHHQQERQYPCWAVSAPRVLTVSAAVSFEFPALWKSSSCYPPLPSVKSVKDSSVDLMQCKPVSPTCKAHQNRAFAPAVPSAWKALPLIWAPSVHSGEPLAIHSGALGLPPLSVILHRILFHPGLKSPYFICMLIYLLILFPLTRTQAAMLSVLLARDWPRGSAPRKWMSG